MSISPISATLPSGGVQQFTATVSGSRNEEVSWSATGGSVSSEGLYTAPPTAGRFTVTATSQADTMKSASSTVTVTATPVVAVSISPASASLLTGVTQQFTATITGTSNAAVTWSTTGGTVSTDGLYTAPAATGTYTVTATSQADTTKSAFAAVTVTATPVVAVSVSPGSASLLTGGTREFA
ncbi:MAG: Ig-like domain-containing protein, partial [Candidatus Sulfotelmatobacter sp.]